MGTEPLGSEAALARERFEDEAVSAERSFAIRAAYDGIRAAFLSVLAEDSLILGDGPEPGRAAYEALPSDYPGRLLWEPAVVAASTDGTLACTSGPYRMLDGAGQEKSTGIYLSVWRRHPGSGLLELVLDFGAKGAEFPEGDGLRRLAAGPSTHRAPGLRDALAACLHGGRWPRAEGALVLGVAEDGLRAIPSGFHVSEDGELGVLWGPRRRSDGTHGVTAALVAPGSAEPRSLLWLRA